MTRIGWLAVVGVGLGCASAPSVPEAALEFKATGSIQRGSFGASFDASHVVNPGVNLSRHADGSWTGTFAQSGVIDVSVSKDAIRGIGFVLIASQPAPGKTVYDGNVNGKRFHFELGETLVTVKTPRYEGRFEGASVPGYPPRFEGGGLILTGDAATPGQPPWPNMALALVAAFI
jgi:hypothetical protein